ncbi:hypothetical protein SDC9_120341 [bioreactor metagenome]|uniref:Uncharacterized protein n=1 Tax=bioreactor metagenome TaxID=1076179 RepID=A0A645C843_9ZZZZ
MPLAIDAGARLLKPALHADALQAVLPRKLPLQIVAGDELAQAGVERADVVVLQIDLDEGLPVVVAGMDFHMIEHVVGEVELGPREQRPQVAQRIALAFEQQTVAALQGKALQIHAGRARKVRRAQQLATGVIRPTMQRADDVAAGGIQAAGCICGAGHRAGLAAQDQRLAMAADVGDQLHALRAVHQHAASILVRQATPVATLWYGLFVAHVDGRLWKELLLLAREQLFVEICAHVQRTRGQPHMLHATDVGHMRLLFSVQGFTMFRTLRRWAAHPAGMRARRRPAWGSCRSGSHRSGESDGSRPAAPPRGSACLLLDRPDSCTGRQGQGAQAKARRYRAPTGCSIRHRVGAQPTPRAARSPPAGCGWRGDAGACARPAQCAARRRPHVTALLRCRCARPDCRAMAYAAPWNSPR